MSAVAACCCKASEDAATWADVGMVLAILVPIVVLFGVIAWLVLRDDG